MAIQKALDVISEDWPLPRIAEELGFGAADLRSLVSFTNPDVLPDGALEQIAPDSSDGPLFSHLK